MTGRSLVFQVGAVRARSIRDQAGQEAGALAAVADKPTGASGTPAPTLRLIWRTRRWVEAAQALGAVLAGCRPG
ncbi:hypothetical protein AB0875_05130 [Micromonospora gifhornensis]|uniref:hypothetical protein n=1 Tax=Micromonospora gifhornensis TaxID=84594 RepID=UPI003452F9E6